MRNAIVMLGLSGFALVWHAAGANAMPVHPPFANYSVEINPSSTGLSPIAGFNGGTTAFTGFGVTNYYPAPFTLVSQILSATFYADPGFVFYGAAIGIGQWSYAWNQGSGIGFSVRWSIAGSQYVGGSSNNNPDPNCSNSGIGSWWTGSGSSGCYRLTEGWVNQGGGGSTNIQMMGGAVPILLNNVSSFTVDIVADIWAGGSGYFGDLMTSSFGFSSLDVAALTVEGQPAAVSAPEPAASLILAFGLLAAGRLTQRRLAD